MAVKLDYSASGVAGTINLRRFDKDQDQTTSSLNGGTPYSLKYLNYNSSTGIISFYVAGGLQCFYKKWHDVEQNGRPDAFITATFVVNGADWCSDKVKYLVVENPSFFYRLRHSKINLNENLQSQDLRCLLAAKGVYDHEDLPQFCLERLSQQQIVDLGISPDIAELLTQEGQNPTGFKAAMYRDYIAQTSNTSRYILAFAGSDDFEDVIENIWQALGEIKFTTQYKTAMRIANEISKLKGRKVTLKGKLIPAEEEKENYPVLEFITTGHSLGGGLASAASVVAGMPARTFNAAGLNRKTLSDASNDVIPDDIRLAALTRFDNGGGNITAYHMDYDILSKIQDSITDSRVPSALGNRILLDSRYDTQIAVGWATIISSVIAGFATGQVLAPLITGFIGGKSILEASVACHKCPELLYGFLVKEGGNGAVIEDLLGL